MTSKKTLFKLFVVTFIGALWFGSAAIFWTFSNSQLGGCQNALEIETSGRECGGPSLLFLASVILPYLFSILLIIREKK
ncbi:hypothetical protein [Parasphingorhabdus sp.]